MLVPIHILLVEDNEVDILLNREAFEEDKILTNLYVLKGGKEAMGFLTRQGKYTSVLIPDK